MFAGVRVVKSLRPTSNRTKAALAKKSGDDPQNDKAAAGPPLVTLVSLGDVEKARGRFREAIDKALALGDGAALGLDLVSRLAAIQEARNRIALERLAYDDVRERLDGQERKAAAEEARQLALTNTSLAKEQARYTRSNLWLTMVVAAAVVGHAVAAFWSIHRH
jgi:hypothetical protein